MKKYTEKEKNILLKCDCISEVKNNRIIYKEDFKNHAVNKYYKGKSPKEIFIFSNFPIHLFDKTYPKTMIKRWKIKNKQKNNPLISKIQKSNNTRLKDNDIKNLNDAVHLIAYLKEENEYLKKSIALETKRNWKKKR